jgi:RES domain-containing protein
VRVWRLARRAHAALDGGGARRDGGRWNSPGRPLVYSSSHLSLAALEVLVHFDVDEVPEDLRAFAIEIPDALAAEQVTLDTLPTGWTRQAFASRAFGDDWLAAARTPVLVVPSAIIPEETNVLVNPSHPATQGVRVVASRRFAYDPRLL